MYIISKYLEQSTKETYKNIFIYKYKERHL